MRKRTGYALCILTGLYICGILAGSLYQVNISEQAEMYEYLKSGVSGYSEGIIKSIKASLLGNIPELLVMFLSGYLPFGLYLSAGALAVKGFMIGFATTCAMRVYGFFGCGLCIGNILSGAVTVPCLIGYGILMYTNEHTENRVKWGFFSLLFLGAVLLTDGIMRGGLASIVTRMWR